MYGEHLLDHFENPRNIGDLSPPAVTVEVSNPACGDTMRLAVEFAEGRVVEVRHRTYGCVAAIAAGSALTEWMDGKSSAEIQALNASAVEALVGGLPKESKHAAVLAADAARAWLRAWAG